jgi:hypothetical protein
LPTAGTPLHEAHGADLDALDYHGLTNMLTGARLEEAEAAKK